MKNQAIIITVILLVLSIGNYFRISGQSNTRTVEFVSILAIGAFVGILVQRLATHFKQKNKE
ncbi:MAG TPA: hypothetical protein PL029_05660 [Bacteroidia bacterium]|nr:hypothetical protein [Bacteroidia bacterium]